MAVAELPAESTTVRLWVGPPGEDGEAVCSVAALNIEPLQLYVYPPLPPLTADVQLILCPNTDVEETGAQDTAKGVVTTGAVILK